MIKFRQVYNDKEYEALLSEYDNFGLKPKKIEGFNALIFAENSNGEVIITGMKNISYITNK